MNCDDAFDALTDPARRNSEQLQWHLDSCPRCRQMQETLEPAMALFDPAADQEAGFSPPGPEEAAMSGPFLSAETIQLAEQAAGQMASQAPRNRFSLRRASAALIQTAALLLIGLIGSGMAFGLFGWFSEPETTRPATQGSAVAEQCVWQLPVEQRQTPTPTVRSVVLSCVACHLEGSLD